MRFRKSHQWGLKPSQSWYDHDPCMCGHERIHHTDEHGCQYCTCPVFDLDVDGLLDDLTPGDY